jgi:membrane-bound lytic murein transglycosylase B
MRRGLLRIWTAAAAALAALAVSACAGAATDRPPAAAPRTTLPAALPAPNAAIPQQPGPLAHRLLVTTRALRQAVDGWREEGNPARGRPPTDVELLALYQQRIYRLLRRNEGLARATFRKLPSGLAREARAIVGAGRRLARITPALQARRIRTRRPAPIGELLRHYRDAERRFDVPWELLAAVNFVESAFGKIRTDSAAGAQGPMQFMPATWAAYGLGGDVHDDRDAIMGAANYLRASGAPRNVRRALWHYNHSTRYVDAVLAYTRRIESDPRNLYVFYSWQLFVRTERGDLRLTGPGR